MCVLLRQKAGVIAGQARTRLPRTKMMSVKTISGNADSAVMNEIFGKQFIYTTSSIRVSEWSKGYIQFGRGAQTLCESD